MHNIDNPRDLEYTLDELESEIEAQEKRNIKFVGEYKDGKKWNGREYRDGKPFCDYKNGKKIFILLMPEAKIDKIPGITEEEIKNIRINSRIGIFENKIFKFGQGVEKKDDLGEYIVLNGKKIYKLGEKKNGIFYNRDTKGELIIGKYTDGKLDGEAVIYHADGRKYIGEIKDKKKWNGKYYKDGKVISEYKEGQITVHLYMSEE